MRRKRLLVVLKLDQSRTDFVGGSAGGWVGDEIGRKTPRASKSAAFDSLEK